MSLRSLVHNLKFNKWNLAFVEESLEEIITNRQLKPRWMKGNSRKLWYADPFILDVTDKTIVCLVEELAYSTMKGRIARLEIDRKTYRLMNTKILLDLPTHLSFPFIFRKDDEIFIIPENSASGRITIYKYDNTHDKLIPFSVIADRPLTDATIFRDGIKSYLFTTQKPTPNGNILDIYELDNDTLKVGERPIQSVIFDNNRARNAGEPFCACGRQFRPAQDCNGGYGKGIIIQEIQKEKEKYKFIDVCSFYPDSWKYNMGYHTFNHYNGLTVIDAHGYRFLLLGRVLEMLSRLVKRIIK